MSLSQPSRVIVVEPVRAATTAPAPPGESSPPVAAPASAPPAQASKP